MVALGLLGGSAACAQEAMYTQAATMPSPGTWVVREQFHYMRFGSVQHGDEHVRKIDRYELLTTAAYGVARDWAVYLDVPLEWRRFEVRHGDHEHYVTEREWGVGELSAMLKWRFYKEDTGGVDTRRAALLLGAEFPSGSNISDNSVDPFIGAVYTQVWGRHGFNQDVIFRLNTGGDPMDNFGGKGAADALFFNTAYLYRTAPAQYTAETTGSYYATIELSNIYETNGDFEMRWAPGFMYEGRHWAWEIMAQFPLYQDVDRRPELDFSIGFGVRLAF